MANRISLSVKTLILVLTLACLGLHYKSLVESRQLLMLTSGSFVGFSVIQIAIILAQGLGTQINKRIEILFGLFGAAMFLASGVLLIQYYNNIQLYVSEADKLALTKGILAVVNGLLFLVSSVFSFQD